jgi:hypothetical protein
MEGMPFRLRFLPTKQIETETVRISSGGSFGRQKVEKENYRVRIFCNFFYLWSIR